MNHSPKQRQISILFQDICKTKVGCKLANCHDDIKVTERSEDGSEATLTVPNNVKRILSYDGNNVDVNWIWKLPLTPSPSVMEYPFFLQNLNSESRINIFVQD